MSDRDGEPTPAGPADAPGWSGPLVREGALQRAVPFATVGVLAFIAVALPSAQRNAGELIAAAALMAAIAAAALLVPWARLPVRAQAAVPLAYLVVVALMRDGQGGPASGYGPLVMLAVLWLALYHRREELIAGIVGVGLVYLVPVLAGIHGYGVNEWARTAIWVAVSGVVGVTTQELVARTRARGVELTAVADVTRRLSRQIEPGESRVAICRAAVALTDASVAALWEADDRGGIVNTAAAGMELAEQRWRMEDPSATARALRTCQPTFVAYAQSSSLVSAALKATGVQSVACRPVMRDEKAIAVIVIAWAAELTVLPERLAPVIDLLAAEAAVAIERAELTSRLAEQALTDPLTGLPNRRAWQGEVEREVARAQRTGRPLCVAVLDLDHLKGVNDRLGHDRGDLLIRLAASSWRAQLRTVDVLARLGGDEFAVALPDTDLATAGPVIERMRMATPSESTCSAGLALWDGREQLGQLMGRADGALYEAKRLGRNRTRLAAAGEVASA